MLTLCRLSWLCHLSVSSQIVACAVVGMIHGGTSSEISDVTLLCQMWRIALQKKKYKREHFSDTNMAVRFNILEIEQYILTFLRTRK